MTAIAGENTNTSDNTDMENTQENEDLLTQCALNAVEFQALQVVRRLEAAEGGGDGQAWTNCEANLPSKPSDEILAMLGEMIAHDESSPEEESPPQLDAIARLAVVSHSVAAYVGGLDRAHQQHLSNKITADTTRWISHLFRFYDCATFAHEDMLEGLVRVLRMLLHRRYPRYHDDGYEALAGRPPVLYACVTSHLGLLQYMCRQVGLPLRCIRAVPCEETQQRMDDAALEAIIEEDKLLNRTPLMVLADAGGGVGGSVDRLDRLQEACLRHDVWLHLRGHNLAALTLSQVPSEVTRIADSFTLPLGVWLGVPSLPVITVYRVCEPRNGSMAGLRSEALARRVPLWCALQALGQDGLRRRAADAFSAAAKLSQRVAKFPGLRLLSPAVEDTDLEEVTSLESVSSSVVFQFVPEELSGASRVPAYYDKLNSWLGQILQRDAPQVSLELCELECAGVVLRNCPLETGDPVQPTTSDLDAFCACLEAQLEILVATVAHKRAWSAAVTAEPRLLAVEVPGWAGLGGVRYAPQGRDPVMTDAGKQELNRLNVALVDALRATDAAFSLGEGEDGLACVRFGMVTADTDVDELLRLVVTVGQEVEESSRFLDNMTEIVKKGIEAATLDLQKENEDRIWQEGILRHVPVFGSLVNWWSPPSKEGGVRGRSLNLQAGVVESTENIYRYHMQQPGTQGPSKPQVQTPLSSAPQEQGAHGTISPSTTE